MSAPLEELLHYLANWCAEEEVRLRQQLKKLEAGKTKTRERRGTGTVDTTAETTERVRAALVDLDAIMSQADTRNFLYPPAKRDPSAIKATLKTATAKRRTKR